MLGFLRKVRKSLILSMSKKGGSGNAKKYTFYAIGEIALVVIGILIALQVNNWNQNRLEAKEEKEILKAISKDMKRVHSYLRVCSDAHQNILDASNRLLNVAHSISYPTSEETIKTDISLLFGRCLVGEGLTENIYDVLMGSDQLEILSSKILRNEIGSLDSWIGTLIPYDQLQAEFVDAQLKPFVNKFVDRTEMRHISPSWSAKIDTAGFETRFTSSYIELLKEREFANLLVDLIIHTKGVIGMYVFIENSMGVIDSILLSEMPLLEPEILARTK